MMSLRFVSLTKEMLEATLETLDTLEVRCLRKLRTLTLIGTTGLKKKSLMARFSASLSSSSLDSAPSVLKAPV